MHGYSAHASCVGEKKVTVVEIIVVVRVDHLRVLVPKIEPNTTSPRFNVVAERGAPTRGGDRKTSLL